MYDEVKASFDQNQGKRGQRVTLRVEYAGLDANRPLAKSVVQIAGYGIYDVMKREEDGRYSWSYTIPWEAPIQSYVLDVYGVDPEGNKGPVGKVSFQVTG